MAHIRTWHRTTRTCLTLVWLTCLAGIPVSQVSAQPTSFEPGYDEIVTQGGQVHRVESASTAPASAAPSVTGSTSAATPKYDLEKDQVLYVVGYAHLDTQWRWDYRTTIDEYIPNTLNDNFALFEKYPNYVFNFTGSRRYRMMKEYYPESYEKLKAWVAKGRWFNMGSSVDECDVNVPSTESLIRQVLYGNKFFRREFGEAGVDFMLPDCFGFPASLPSVLAHCGLKGFSTQKLTWGSAVGVPFNVGTWVGPDGESITAALNPGAYVGKVTGDLSQSRDWIQRIAELGKEANLYIDYHYYGTGDQGGAPAESSVEWIQKSVEGQGPVKIVLGSSDQMYKDLTPAQRKRLPTYKGDLLLTEHSAGTLTSQAYMKRWNRKNELLADVAERSAVMADWLGSAEYPSRKLLDAWYLVLGSQMHDILPGTSLPIAYEFSWNDEVIALNQFAEVLKNSVGGVARSLDTQADGIPVIVVNPLSIERREVVEAKVNFKNGAPAQVRVLGSDGKETPAQIIAHGDDWVQLLFVAHVPSIGMAVYDVQPGAPARAKPSAVGADKFTLNNERYRVTIDRNGDINSVLDKRAKAELLSAPMRLAMLRDAPSQWPAWNMDWKDLKAEPREYVTGPAKITVEEDGPIRATIRIERETAGSTFVQYVRLMTGEAADRLQVDNVIDWHTRGTCLKTTFPLSFGNPMARYNQGLGTIERENDNARKYEVPSHEWFSLSAPDKTLNVAVMEDCKFGSDKPSDSELRLTLIRTPEARQFRDQATQDLGRHHMSYALTSWQGDWTESDIQYRAARLNQPLLTFQTVSHNGPLGKAFSFLKMPSRQVAVQAVKKAEASDEIVVRVQELYGRSAKKLRLHFAAPIRQGREVNGQEQPRGPADVRGGELIFDLKPYEPKTFAVRLDAPHARQTPPVSRPLELAYDIDGVSSNQNRADGDFDGQGRTYPQEMLPETVVSEDVTFRLGPHADGKRNFLSCRGQTIKLPYTEHDRLYMLAAAASPEDIDATFKLSMSEDADQDDNAKPQTRTIQSWSGYVGQWDNRVWKSGSEISGIMPGYIKRTPIAWDCSHRHSPTDGDESYHYTYLFKYALDVPRGATSLVLPDEPRVRIAAITLASDRNDDTVPAQLLYDDASGLRIEPAGGSFGQPVEVAMSCMGSGCDALVYTLDGSAPQANSPVYGHPFQIDHPVTLSAQRKLNGVLVGRVMRARFEFPEPLPAVAVANPKPGVNFRYFEGEWDQVPDFDAMSPKLKGELPSVDIDRRQRDTAFGFAFDGVIKIPLDDVYTITCGSDDGSRLFVDGKLVVDNDGLHGMEIGAGEIALKAGWHKIRVEYFNRYGDYGLVVGIKGGGLNARQIPAKMLAHE